MNEQVAGLPDILTTRKQGHKDSGDGMKDSVEKTCYGGRFRGW